MRSLIFLAACLAASAFAGEPARDMEHPPLVELIRSADLVALTRVETKNNVLVYRILESLKGEYKPENFPEMYKGTYTLYTPAKEIHDATDKAVIVVKFPGKVKSNDDQLIMFLKNGSIDYPRITRSVEIVKTEKFTLDQIRAMCSKVSD